MADVQNYSLRGVKAQHFTGPTSSGENGFRTVPDLLRAVATWMDENDIQDPEVEALDLKCTFTGEDDEFYENVTVYHLESAEVAPTTQES